MLIRFTTLAKDSDSGHTGGVLVAAHTLRDEGDLSPEEHLQLRGEIGWFNKNLLIPTQLEQRHNRRAISWFKPSANEAIQRMWRLKALLELHGIHVNVLRTSEPGTIIYEDAWQVVAKPSKGQHF